MNGLHYTLLGLAAVFVALFLLSPRRPRLAFGYARYVVLSLAALVILMPFIWLVTAVFKDPAILNEHMFLPPPGEWSSETINLRNFRELFTGRPSVQGMVYFWHHIINSVFLASASTFLQLLFSSMGGYALAKYDFRGKGPVISFMLGSMMIPGVILLAPMFDLIFRIGWMDSYLALLVPGACSVFGMFLFRQAMLSVPDDIIEAGRIDGCSEFHIYLKVVMPLVRPMSAAFCLVAFLGSWNSFIAPNVFIYTRAKLTLPVILNLYVGQYAQQYGVFLAGTLLAIIPPAVLFFSLQREFISGLTSGALKE
jgi:ABC-type glycerol-3-phosphate transport system permease component